MRVLQHIPSFSDSEGVKTYVFTPAELAQRPFIRSWTEDPGFYRFSVHRNYWANPSDKCDQMHLLLAEFKEGKEWWVVAYLSGEDALEILVDYPEWVKPP